MKKVAIVQSNYIPWRGYFELINSVDEFLLLDCVQYTRRDWRNRNKIKLDDTVRWLTISVQNKGNYFKRIDEILVSDKIWANDHWNKIRNAYRKSRYFNQYSAMISAWYEEASELASLSDINKFFLVKLCEILEITTPIISVVDDKSNIDKSQRLCSLCLNHNANVYISGPAAQSYLDIRVFSDVDISVEWMKYNCNQPYTQVGNEFIDDLSILDVIFNCGPNSKKMIEN